VVSNRRAAKVLSVACDVLVKMCTPLDKSQQAHILCSYVLLMCSYVLIMCLHKILCALMCMCAMRILKITQIIKDIANVPQGSSCSCHFHVPGSKHTG
jgi:hypothetical protein